MAKKINTQDVECTEEELDEFMGFFNCDYVGSYNINDVYEAMNIIMSIHLRTFDFSNTTLAKIKSHFRNLLKKSFDLYSIELEASFTKREDGSYECTLDVLTELFKGALPIVVQYAMKDG